MAVRKLEKKVVRPSDERDIVASSPELMKIRAMIKTLPTDEGDTVSEKDEGAEVSTKKKIKKPTKVKKVKKVSKPAKAAKKVKAAASDGTPLSSICKTLKMEPRTARRILRNAGVKNTDGRWNFNASGAEKARKVLSEARA